MMAVAILPYRLKSARRLADIPLTELAWPLGSGARQGTVRDLTADDHLIVAPSSRRLYYPGEKLSCSLSLRITEPYAVHRRHYLAMYVLWPRFFRIFTRCQRLASRIPNARALPLTTTWVTQIEMDPPNKTKRMSLIASSKQDLKGHRLRHQIARWITESGMEVDLLGRAFQPFDKKEEGLAPYRYSVIIENSREPGYFSEKLMDCLLCRTIPIYWGAPDVGRYFNVDGMVICDSERELKRAIKSLGDSDYGRLSVHAEENRKRALCHVNQERILAELLEREVARSKRSSRNKESTHRRRAA